MVLAVVWLAWVFFRAESFSQAVGIVRLMLSFNSEEWTMPAGAAFLVPGILAEVLAAFRARVSSPAHGELYRHVLEPVVLALAFAACVFLRGPGAEFIYFQF